MFNIDALSTATATRPFWSQDIHSRMPFHAYEFPLDVPLLGKPLALRSPLWTSDFNKALAYGSA